LNNKKRPFIHSKHRRKTFTPHPRSSVRCVCREILEDGSVWYFSGLYPSGRAVGAPHQQARSGPTAPKPSAQLQPEPAAPSRPVDRQNPSAQMRGASHHGALSLYGGQSQHGTETSRNGGRSQHGMPSRNVTARSGAELHGDVEQISGGETPWCRVLNSAVGDAYYWNKVCASGPLWAGICSPLIITAIRGIFTHCCRSSQQLHHVVHRWLVRHERRCVLKRENRY